MKIGKRGLSSLIVLLAIAPCSAGTIYSVSLDTTPLVGHAAGPFSLNFQLNDGSGVGDANNTAVLDSFTFGPGGSVVGTPRFIGGASGDFTASVTLTDSFFFNAFTQEFVPGTLLSFRLDLTTNVNVGFQPDQFSMAILDNTGFELPYDSPLFAALVIDIDSANPTPLTFATDQTIALFGGGEPVAMDAPTIVSAVPEPPSCYFTGGGLLAALCVFRHCRISLRKRTVQGREH